jgi:chromosome segregation ATPase
VTSTAPSVVSLKPIRKNGKSYEELSDECLLNKQLYHEASLELLKLQAKFEQLDLQLAERDAELSASQEAHGQCIQELQAEIRSLHEELDMWNKLNSSDATLRQRIAALETLVSEYQIQVEEHDDELDAAKVQIDTLTTENEELTQKLEYAHADANSMARISGNAEMYKQLHAKIAAQEDEIDGYVSMVKRLEAELTQTAQEFPLQKSQTVASEKDAEIEALKEKHKSEMKTALEHQKMTRRDYAKTLKEKDAEIEQLKKELEAAKLDAEKDAEIARLKQELEAVKLEKNGGWSFAVGNPHAEEPVQGWAAFTSRNFPAVELLVQDEERAVKDADAESVYSQPEEEVVEMAEQPTTEELMVEDDVLPEDVPLPSNRRSSVDWVAAGIALPDSDSVNETTDEEDRDPWDGLVITPCFCGIALPDSDSVNKTTDEEGHEWIDWARFINPCFCGIALPDSDSVDKTTDEEDCEWKAPFADEAETN